jgi:hypothetical protein
MRAYKMRFSTLVLILTIFTSHVAAQDTKTIDKPVKGSSPASSAPPKPEKDTGIFVEGFGAFTKSYSSGDSLAEGSATAPATYKLPNTTGFGFGGSVGYQLLENLGLVASFQYRSIKSREWSQTNTSATGAGVSNTALTAFSLTAGTGSATIQNKRNSVVMGLGIRPTVKWGAMRFYAGGGAALIFPHDDVTTYVYTGINASATQIANATTTKTTSWNLGLGAYGETGLLVDVTDSIYLGLGSRFVLAEVTDNGKDTVNKTTGTGAGGSSATFTETTTGSETVPSPNTATILENSQANNTATYTTTGAKTNYKSYAFSDVSISLIVGFRF